MSQNPTKKFKIAALPKVVHRKRMAQRVKRAAYTSNAELAAYGLKITKDIPLGNLAALLGAKDQTVLVAGQVPVEDLAQLNAHWYESLFVSLSFDPKHEVVKIHVTARQAQQLVYSKAGIQRSQGKGMKSHIGTL